ncbi:hypothetical protein TNCV_205261 [Trichonephila clavipes]|nr:hypothetical protein TNCV_205261 [Trichonephila clavipes]
MIGRFREIYSSSKRLVLSKRELMLVTALQLSAKPKTHHPDEEHKPRLPDSIARPIANMPLSRMENTTFAMPSIIDSHDMGLRTVFTVQTPKRKSLFNAYSTIILYFDIKDTIDSFISANACLNVSFIQSVISLGQCFSNCGARPLVHRSLAVALSSIHVTEQFSSVSSQCKERTPWRWSGPPTYLPFPPTSQEDLRLDGYLNCPHAERKGTIHLQTFMSSPGFEPSPNGT